MNDNTRLQLELYFDGELPADRLACTSCRIAEDQEGRQYLDRLTKLRAIAQCHGSRADRSLTRAQFSSSHFIRTSHAWAATAAAAAAVIVALVLRGDGSTLKAPKAASHAHVAGSVEALPHHDLPIWTQEVALYTWANSDRRQPKVAASALLSPQLRSAKRPAAAEILALELTNGSRPDACKLEPLAFVHQSAPGSRSRNERHHRHFRLVTPGTESRSTLDCGKRVENLARGLQ